MCPVGGVDRQWANLDTLNALKKRGFTDAQIQTWFTTYQNNWFSINDLDNLKTMGVNCIRVPFWYRNFMLDEAGTWITGTNLNKNPGIQKLDWVIRECGNQEQGSTREVIAVLKRKINSSLTDLADQSTNAPARAHGYPEKGPRTRSEEPRTFRKSKGYEENRADHPGKGSKYSEKGFGYKGKSSGYEGKASGYKGKSSGYAEKGAGYKGKSYGNAGKSSRYKGRGPGM